MMETLGFIVAAGVAMLFIQALAIHELRQKLQACKQQVASQTRSVVHLTDTIEALQLRVARLERTVTGTGTR
jgi:hypothetical protein